MTDPVCEFCGAADPRWIRHVDTSVLDFFTRVLRRWPGPTTRAVFYCDTPQCAAEMEARYGPSGNRAALNRLIDELGAKGLDADDNEVRMAALCAEWLNSHEAAGA